ncbi:response regulator transcription factor [Cyanobium sp. FACHB-13342]|uniref:response regulator transcription factor n=1 Tax=Cyanobium sp. FACHB-13342 TaxID=2692793 RepID=UPI0016814396|nr:response regulator transcription factor [Cyanobium sp. FACHB-13342]MBD2422749.1 response regulator transcription factor [Cyanobium sp. FACHB-13342]
MSIHRLLIVDDDPELRHFLRTELEIEGYGCSEAATGQQALAQIRAERWDLLLLDWTLPDFSGVEICRRLRGSGDHTPVLMLTARDDVRERVEALDAGADDYLTKPFSIEELLARVRARLRRRSNGTDAQESLRLADLELTLASREVSRSGEPVLLSGREFELLLLLLREPNRVHSREAILSAVWGDQWVGDDNVLDVYIRALRRKLEREGQPTLIQTVRGVGFMLKEGPPKT